VKARAACPGFLLCALSLLKREFVLAMAMSETWKQQVVIDSRSTAGLLWNADPQ